MLDLSSANALDFDRFKTLLLREELDAPTYPVRSLKGSYFAMNPFVRKCIKLNPLPDMPILGSSNSAANKDMVSKI